MIGFHSLIAVLTLAMVGSNTLSAQEPEINLDTIRRRVTQWQQRISNVRVVWSMRALPTTTTEPLSAWSVEGELIAETRKRFTTQWEWIWAEQGLELYRSGRGTHVFNGSKELAFSTVHATSEGERQLISLDIHRTRIGRPLHAYNVLPMSNLYWGQYANWLPAILTAWAWDLEGMEEIHGAQCVRLSVRDARFERDALWTTTLWIDPQHGCLVRRSLRRRAGQEASGTDFIVDEFQPLESGLWFPKRGRVQLPEKPDSCENQFWEVSEAAVNELLDLNQFNPPNPEPGTKVEDRDGVLTASDESTTGSRRGTSPQNSVDKPARQRNADWFLWSTAFLVLSVGFLAIGLWLRKPS